ncbi:MAG: hypothetical protein HYY20_13850 [Candidatus Tectomicrobia bacterium]|uniref:Uncharacterized protein n=1 Tax=Tectimicrobiota bacterium TaxID=2528274 RepID=A0A932CR10_UNCTE|nr:hypothetical protein [Candidatus Tectomicrobia bacterium]
MAQLSEYFKPIIESTYDAMCDVLNNPALWSDHMIHKTLERAGGKPFNVEDVRLLVKDYLAVLCELIRKEGRLGALGEAPIEGKPWATTEGRYGGHSRF